MKVYSEISLSDFEAWSGGEDTLNRIINAGLVDTFESILEELYPDGIDETSLNDLLRFEDDWIFETLGLETDDSLQEKIDELEEEASDLLEEISGLLEEIAGYNSDLLEENEKENPDEEEIFRLEDLISDCYSDLFTLYH